MGQRDLLLLATPRCGSDLFVQWVLKLHTFGWAAEWLGAGTLPRVCRELELPEGWRLAEFVSQLRARKASADGRVAIKLMWDTFAWSCWKGQTEGLEDGVFSCLDEPFLIRLCRRDLLAQAVSLFKARASGRWHTDGAAPSVDVPYDAAGILTAFLEILAGERAWAAWLDRSDRPHQVVFHEDFVERPRAVLKQVFREMDLPRGGAIDALEPPWNRRLASANNRELKARFLDEHPELLAHVSAGA